MSKIQTPNDIWTLFAGWYKRLKVHVDLSFISGYKTSKDGSLFFLILINLLALGTAS